jgi:TolB-like protein
VTAQTARKLDVITIVAIVAIAAVISWQQFNPPMGSDVSIPSGPTAGSQEPSAGVTGKDIANASIAVLPFADLSPDNDQSHFSDGIAEEILNVLVHIDSLKVASRTSAFGFKGQQALGIPLIAERLKVRHILEGSVRKSGDTVRITAQLIDAKTDGHLWSETFDRKLTTENIFAAQDEIAGAIVKQLGLLIGDPGAGRAAVKVTAESMDAYEIYLKAQGLFHIRSEKNLPEIIELYAQAVAIDPEFAEAWAGLSAG